MLFIIRHETWYRRIFTIACVAEIDHCLSHFSQIEHDAKWVQRVAYHLNHGTSVKVVVEFGKSLKGYTINQLKMRNQKKCNWIQLKHLESSPNAGVALNHQPSILDLTSIPVRFVDPLEFDRQNELTRNKDTFHVDVHKIQVLSLTWNIYVVIVYVFFCIKWTNQRLWTSFTALTLSPHQKLDASKSISYTTVGPSAQTVQANSRQPLVGTGKNVKQLTTLLWLFTDHCSLAYRAQNHGPSNCFLKNDWGRVEILAKKPAHMLMSYQIAFYISR